MKAEWFVDECYIKKCLAGDMLFGDSFCPDEIKHWFELEEQAYAGMVEPKITVVQDRGGGYVYNSLNQYHAFSKLPKKYFENVLGFGSAYGDEFIPIKEYLGHIQILEPGSIFTKHHLTGKEVTYHIPNPFGDMIFESDTFDLVICFSALHHIPNVSKIISEFSRVMKPGAWLLIREPTTSMGNWCGIRKGATPCERGIPPKLMRQFF